MVQNPYQNYIVNFVSGERIFSEGDIGTTMFVVQSGQVRLFREKEGERKMLGTMEKGDFFGEMSVLEGLPRTICAEAIEECELIEINSMTFDRMIRGNIEIAVRMLRKLSIRLREAEKTIESMQWQLERQPVARSSPAETAAVAHGKTRERPLPLAGGPAPAAPIAPLASHLSASPSPVPSPASSGASAGPIAAPTAPLAGSPAPVSAPQGAFSSERAAPASPAAASTLPGAPSSAIPRMSTQPAAPIPTPALAIPPPQPRVSPGAAAASRVSKRGPRLVSEAGDIVFPLEEGDSLIGRYDPVTETQPAVDLTPLDIKRSVSRRHARITAAQGNFFLMEEVGALNGTFVNGTRLTTGRPTPLKDGDCLGLGTVNLIFRL